MMSENATIDIRVKASQEFLAEMSKDWSRPLEVRAQKDHNGDWSLTFREPLSRTSTPDWERIIAAHKTFAETLTSIASNEVKT